MPLQKLHPFTISIWYGANIYIPDKIPNSWKCENPMLIWYLFNKCGWLGGVYKSPQNLFNAKLEHQDITRDSGTKAMQVLTTTSGKLLSRSSDAVTSKLKQRLCIRRVPYATTCSKWVQPRMQNSWKHVSYILSLHVSDTFCSYLNDSIQCFLIKYNA